MYNHSERTSPFTDINGVVAALLDDVAERPVPRGSKARLAEIRLAVAEGKACINMALDIIDIFPNEKAA